MFRTSLQRIQAPKSTVRMLATESNNGRVFTSFNVYKGKAALKVKPLPPQLVSSQQGGRYVKNFGGLLLELAPASDKPREYDWNRKVTFLLSHHECGELLILENGKTMELTHDPKAGTQDAGKIVKRFKMSPGYDNKGFFLSVQQQQRAEDGAAGQGQTAISIAISAAELETLKTVARFYIPRMLAFDQV